MKLFLLLFIMSTLGATSMIAQNASSTVDTVKGKKASYYRIKKDKRLMVIRNVRNVDTTRDMYFDDGKIVPGEWELGGKVKYTLDEIGATLKEVLTTEEWNALVNVSSRVLQIWIVTDKLGNPREIDFTFRNTDPVFTKIDPDRLFQLEEKLKNLLKLEVSDKDRGIKNLKYFVALTYGDLK